MNFAVLLLAYLIGGIPVGFLLVKLKTGEDVRAAGSGNIGATNVHRTAGKLAGVATLLLDAAKGYFAVWIAYRVSGESMTWASAAAVAVMMGHIYTPFLQFKGGKGVATFLGVFLFLTPAAIVAVTLIFITAVVIFRIISLGSILGAACFPLAVWLIAQPAWPLLTAAVICSSLAIFRHIENAKRINAGTERVFQWGAK